MKRRSFLLGTLSAGSIAALTACSPNSADSSSSSSASTASSSAAATPTGALAFDAETYTEQTLTVTTNDGDVEVAYRFYGPITYVEKPVDEEYQSLVISVPTSINGEAVDTSNAPILLANSVGGYMPSSVASATSIGDAGMFMDGGMGMPSDASGEAPTGEMPSGEATPTSSTGSGTVNAAQGSNAMLGSSGEMVSLQNLAIAAGFVVVEPGCRGRTLVDDSGVYYGVAPAAIVDLKAAVRYLRYNDSLIPADTSKIVTSGTSAGGALSALLGASGNSPMYDSYLKELGAADASDAIFASGDWCPIIDLENADGAYEWCWGTLSYSEDIDSEISSDLKGLYTSYFKSQGLEYDGSTLDTDNYSDYLLKEHLQPSATRYLADLSDSDRESYLSENSFITWENDSATFSWEDFLTHVGQRGKAAPAFDAIDLSNPENNLFGLDTTEARHFTTYSANKAGESLASDITEKTQLMNPMYHLANGDSEITKNWWIRVGASDVDTALNMVGSLSLKNQMLGNNVNTKMYWDAGHGTNQDPEDFIAWISEITA